MFIDVVIRVSSRRLNMLMAKTLNKLGTHLRLCQDGTLKFALSGIRIVAVDWWLVNVVELGGLSPQISRSHLKYLAPTLTLELQVGLLIAYETLFLLSCSKKGGGEGGGQHSSVDSILTSRTQLPRVGIPIPDFFFRKIISYRVNQPLCTAQNEIRQCEKLNG